MEVQPTTKILSRSFSPPEFVSMFQDDPLSKSGRYDDICGPDIGYVMPHVGWTFMDSPVTIGIQLDKKTVAVGFVAPIILDTTKKANKVRIDGFNLSYTVHSEHEGNGFGLKASCLAILEAEKEWGHLIRNGLLNIQTRSVNVRGNHLAKLLNATVASGVGFSATIKNGTVLEYAGYRSSWKDGVERAKECLRAEWNQPRDADELETAEVPKC
jgi:hypothetical protein